MKLFLFLMNLAILAFLPLSVFSTLNVIAIILLGAAIYFEGDKYA